MEGEIEKKGGVSELLKSKKVVIGIIVVIVVIVLGSAFNAFVGEKVGENMAENILESQLGGNVNIDNEGNSFSINTEEGSLNVGENVKWPSDIPKDIPEFKAGNIISAGVSLMGTNSWQIVAENVTKADFEDYRSTLKSDGWVESSSMNAGFDVVQTEKNGITLIFSFNPEDGSFSLVATKE